MAKVAAYFRECGDNPDVSGGGSIASYLEQLSGESRCPACGHSAQAQNKWSGVTIWAKPRTVLNGAVLCNEGLVAVELPANCVVLDGGNGAANTLRIIDVARRAGAAWREQEGVSGAMLDELAEVTK